MQHSRIPRHSAVAGRFYPADPRELRTSVLRYLAMPPQNRVDLAGRDVLAVLVPHAGYVFSGPVVGMTLGQIALPDRIILLGPNHTGRGAPLSVWNGGPWATPLGDVPIDAEAVDCLVASGAGFCPDTKAHLQEHSLEVLLPFLQVMNPKVRITPVTISGLPFAALQKAGEALAGVVGDAAVCGEKILTIVSSDMSHYLPHEEAVEKDSLALSAAETLDPERLFGVVRENAISMCGIFPMTIALFASNRLGARAMDVVARATSGQTGRAFGAGMDKVVGYAGAVITR